MPVIRAPQAPTHTTDDATFTALASPSRGCRETALWRASLSPGARSRVHTVTREELFYVVAGRARLLVGDEAQTAGPGDVIIAAAGVPFALHNDGDCPLEVVCCLPVGGQVALGKEIFTPPWAQ